MDTRLKCSTIVCFLCLPLGAIAASDDSLLTVPVSPNPIIRQIHIFGNKKTKDFIITREMSLHVGDTITDEAVEYDRNRIFSLKLFNRVDIEPVPIDSSGVLLQIDVDERWYIFPIPLVGIRDREWSRWYYGMGVLHDNFLGENQKVWGACAFGYDPFAEILYKNPRFDPEGDVFLTVHTAFARIKNKSLQTLLLGQEFDERQFVVEGQLGKRFGTSSAVWFQLSYASVNVPPPGEGRTLSPDGTDRYVAVQIGGLYDTRDLKEYPRMGTYIEAVINKNGFGSQIDYWRMSTDIRKFFPVGSSVAVGVRGFTNIATGGAVPLYDHKYFGYDERIRGHFKDILEGESILGGTAELHIPILAPIFFTIPHIPIEQFATCRFGIVAAMFADAGQVWGKGTPVALHRFTKGFGGGLHFLLPYSFILRTEIGFDEKGRSQFIFDLGAAL